jgi:hypothetical protein
LVEHDEHVERNSFYGDFDPAADLGIGIERTAAGATGPPACATGRDDAAPIEHAAFAARTTRTSRATRGALATSRVFEGVRSVAAATERSDK